LTEDELEEITNEWSTNLFVPADPVKMSDVNNPKIATDIPRPSKTKNTEEVHDLDNAFVKTASIAVKKGGDGEEIDGAKVEPKKGEVTLPRDEEDP
jgi:hypothetical protein